MKQIWALLAAAGAALFVPPAIAVPQEAKTGEESVAALIPFEPPFGQKLRYRHEENETENGRIERTWSVMDVQFEEAPDGFRMTVFPVDLGTGSDEPILKEMYEKLADLMRRPYVVNLSSDAVIVSIENEDAYWNEVFDAFEPMLSEAASEKGLITPEVKQKLAAYFKLMREMPSEARRALMTEDVQPLVEFAQTEWTTGEPVSGEFESEAPFGGSLKREYHIELTKIDGDLASLTIHSTVPKAELVKLTSAFITKLGGVPDADQESFREAIAGLENFTHETRANYQVSLADGVLESFVATETITAVEKGKKTAKVTSTSLRRVP